jgi:pentatricopeptide repeat protein
MSEHGCTLDIITYSSIIDGLCKGRRVDDAIKLLSDLQSYGCMPDIITNTTVLNVLCCIERWNDAEEFLAEMV